MAMPQLIVEVAFGDAWNVASPTWVNVTAYVRDSPPLRISRGTSRISRPRPGQLTVTFGNNDRRFDPDYASGPYANDLVPMVPIRVTATHNSVTYPLFRGFVADWGVNTQDGKDSTVTVTAVDGLSVLELLKVGQVFNPVRTFGGDVRAWYRFSEPVGATTLLDSSGHGYHGTVSGDVTFGAAGPFVGGTDRAATFGGVSSQVVIDNARFAGSAARSVEVWFKTSATDDGLELFWQYNALTETTPYFGLQIVTGTYLLRLAWGNIIADTGTLSSSVAVNDGEWHQAVATDDGSDGVALYLDGVAQTTSTGTEGTTDFTSALSARIGVYPFAGGLWDQGDISEVILYDFELTAGEVAANYSLGVTPWTGQLTSARITAVLDMIGWPSADRDLDTGISTMGALTDGDISALTAIFQAVDTEMGAAWMTSAGKLWFGNRRWRDISAYSATFSNDGSDTGYQALSWHRDDTELRTVAQVTDSNSAVTEYVGASEATYGPRTISRTTYTTSVTEPYDMATWLYGEFGYANTDADLLLEAGAASATATWAELLSRELGDLVNVEVKPVGGTTQNDWDMFVEDITLSAGVDLWTLRLGLSNAGGATTAGQRGFVLDDATLGQLDGVGRLGF